MLAAPDRARSRSSAPGKTTRLLAEFRCRTVSLEAAEDVEASSFYAVKAQCAAGIYGGFAVRGGRAHLQPAGAEEGLEALVEDPTSTFYIRFEGHDCRWNRLSAGARRQRRGGLDQWRPC